MHFIDSFIDPMKSTIRRLTSCLSLARLSDTGRSKKGLPDINCKGSVTVLSEMVSRWLFDKIMNNKLWLILNLWDEMINDNRPSEGWAGVQKYSCSDSLLLNTLSENHSLLHVMEISWLLKWGTCTEFVSLNKDYEV